jgi:pimeloyl-ACP methyl ester carboxylesterase
VGRCIIRTIPGREWLNAARVLLINRASTHGEAKLIILRKQFLNCSILYGDPSFTPDILAGVKAKSLIIHGDNDDIAPLSNALEMHKSIHGAHLWVAPNGGHVPSYDKKGETDFLRRIMEFLGGEWDK